jgi:release factor glutamine methyltransferase
VKPKIDLDEIYQPAEDTLLLLKAALEEAGIEDAAIEIGCGRALISREIAPLVKSILSTDINPHAVRLTKESGLEVVRADLFRGIAAEFDLIIFNPPYLPSIDREYADEESIGEESIGEESIRKDMIKGWLNFALDGGANGRDIISRFLEDLKGHLSQKGRALLLISSLTGLDEVLEKSKSEGLEATVIASDGCFFERLYIIKLRVAHEPKS